MVKLKLHAEGVAPLLVWKEVDSHEVLLYLCSSISTTESWWQVLQELKRAIKKFLKNLIDSFFD